MKWKQSPTDVYEKRRRKWPAKHRAALEATLDNLDTYFSGLNSGVHPQNYKAKFIRVEQGGVVAVNQSGAKGSPTQVRLYVYADVDTKTLYLITLGDKDTQTEDVRLSADFVRALLQEREQADEQHPPGDFASPGSPEDLPERSGDGAGSGE